MEPFEKTKRPLILHQKIMGNPNMKSIDDKKVVQSPCRREKKGNNFLKENQPGIPEVKKYPRKKKPGGHATHNRDKINAKNEGFLSPGKKVSPEKRPQRAHVTHNRE